MPRPVTKTDILTIRLSPEVKRLIVAAADAERRSQANLIEVMVRDWCTARGIEAAPEPEPPAKPARAARKAPAKPALPTSSKRPR